MNKISLRAVWNVARCEYSKWITNPRMILVGVLLVFIRGFAIVPLLERAERYGEPLHVLEPFLAVCNSRLSVFLLPCAFLLLISDFPVFGGNALFFLNRTGKKNWFLGQVLFMIASIFTYVGVILIFCMGMSKGAFYRTWSNSVTQFDAAFPEEAGGMASELLPPNLYNQMDIFTAFVWIFLLLFLYLLLLAMILCFLKLLGLRGAGLLTAVGVIALGVTTCALKVPAMWYFPMANTIVWLHYEELLREPVTPVSDSFVYFIVILTVFFVGNLLALRKMQLIHTEQEEGL